MGVIIAGILTLAYWAVPTNGISFGSESNISVSQTAQSFVPPLTAPSRGSGGCGV